MAANLTSVAISTRKVIRYGILFIILTIIARFAVGVGINVYKSVVPKPTIAPTARFGPLPALPFPKPNQDLPQLTIAVETASGQIPQYPTQAKVYYMPPYTTNLFSYDNAQKKARAMGFDGDSLQLSDTLYKFNVKDSPGTLEFNIVTNAFSVSYNLAADSSPLSKLPRTAAAATIQAKTVLSSAGLSAEDLMEGEVKTEFLRVEGQNLVSAISLSEANFVKVSLFRKAYDELPAVTADPKQGPVWFIISGSDKLKGLIAGQYRYFPVDDKKFETYPLKTTAQALTELKEGKGYIANLGVNKDGNVTVRDITMGYYDSDTQMQFYQPVYVFKGDRDFVAYVPAVTDQYYGK